MERINHLTVDSTDSITDLCLLGAQYVTDKSPYTKIPERFQRGTRGILR